VLTLLLPLPRLPFLLHLLLLFVYCSLPPLSSVFSPAAATTTTTLQPLPPWPPTPVAAFTTTTAAGVSDAPRLLLLPLMWHHFPVEPPWS
jgi:hypothetical protein